MTTSNIKPNYIPSSPKGEDLFEGKSQERISNTIHELIIENRLPNNVIGLEGKWGSGKSNVVHLLNSKFSKSKSDYHFFTYDAWGHQEDLTRRTFLEELIHSLKNKGKFKGAINWKDELNRLLAKKSTKNTKKFPKIKFYWILIMASILLFAFLTILYDDLFVKIDFLKTYEFPYIKIIISKYLFPISLFVWGLFEIAKEYNSFNKRKETADLDYKERLKQILYIFSGSDIESEELEYILEEEPTVKRFKEYFDNIVKDLKSDGLIIVFDNMDRLSKSEKVLSLWSSIHTFFAEEEIKNVWIIIPYDKEHLSKHFDENNEDKVNNFIGKTFSTSFRISPPVLSDWKSFFRIKFKQAFNEIIEDEDIDFISSLYEVINSIDKRNPRDVIMFINSLVSLYLQHNSKINIKYLAIFSLRSKEILDNPLITISNKSFLMEESYLFKNLNELEESLAAIVYNVSKDKSNEVLLKNNIEDIFSKADIDTLKEIKKHGEFKNYFDKVIQGSDLSKYKVENVVSVFEEIKDVIPESSMKPYWEKLTYSTTHKTKEYLTEFNNWQELILINTSINTAEYFANSIIRKSLSLFRETKKPSDYYRPLFNLISFLNQENIKIQVNVVEIELSTHEFISYIDDLGNIFEKNICTSKDLKIFTNSDDLDNHFSNEDIYDYAYNNKHIINYLIINDDTYSFKYLKDEVNRKIQNLKYTEIKQAVKLFELNKILNSRNKIKLLPQVVGKNILRHNANSAKTEDLYDDIIANQIAHINDNDSVDEILVEELSEIDNVRSISEIIQYYISYEDLLKLVIDKMHEYDVIKEIVLILTKNDFEFRQTLDLKWVFNNLDKIKSQLFEKDFEVFLNRLDEWRDEFDANLIHPVVELPTDVISEVFDKENQKCLAIQFLIDSIVKEFKEATKEQWLKAFKENNDLSIEFKRFVKEELLDKKITQSTAFMNAYEEYLSLIANGKIQIPENESVWEVLIQEKYLNEKKTNRVFDNILDQLINNTNLTIKHLEFFSRGIFNHSTAMIKKADDVSRKIILKLKENNELLDSILKEHVQKIIGIINATNGKYDQDLSEMFTEKMNNSEIDKSLLKEIFNKTTLKILKKND